MPQTVEAVIISGPRKGEIVALPDDRSEDYSDEDIRLLNESLDQIIARLDRLSHEMDMTIEAFRKPLQVA